MAHAIFYMHQTSGACTGVCTCNHTHQIEKTDDTNTLGTCWIRTLPRRVVVWFTYNLFRFSILRSHTYTSTIFLLTNLSSVKTKCLQWRKINPWFLTPIIYKGCMWFSMISTSMEKRYEKLNTVKFKNKMNWGLK